MHRAEDQAIKARREVAGFANVAATASVDNAARFQQLESAIHAIETRTMGLALYSRTVVRLLLEKNVITASDFETRMREIDLLDGRLDGR